MGSHETIIYILEIDFVTESTQEGGGYNNDIHILGTSVCNPCLLNFVYSQIMKHAQQSVITIVLKTQLNVHAIMATTLPRMA